MKKEFFLTVIFTFFWSTFAFACDRFSTEGFKNIPPVNVKMTQKKSYESLCKSLKSRFPQFASAMTYDDSHNVISVHLPCQMVSYVFGNLTTIHWQLEDSTLSELYPSQLPEMCFEIAFCSLSFEKELTQAMQNAGYANFTMTPCTISWKQAAPDKFSKTRAVLDYVFKQNPFKGFIGGESHLDFYGRYWLAKKLPLLVTEYGVQTLVLEVISEELQSFLNAYMDMETLEMPKELEAYLDLADAMNAWYGVPDQIEDRSSYKYLVQSAKKAGIKSIIAIDNAKYSFPVGIKANLENSHEPYNNERLVLMNQLFAEKKSDFQDNYVVLCGLGHGGIYRQCGDIYGLREISGLPLIEFTSSMGKKEIQESSIFFNPSPGWEKNDKAEWQKPDFTIYKKFS